MHAPRGALRSSRLTVHRAGGHSQPSAPAVNSPETSPSIVALIVSHLRWRSWGRWGDPVLHEGRLSDG